jgi:hypothetical protein
MFARSAPTQTDHVSLHLLQTWFAEQILHLRGSGTCGAFCVLSEVLTLRVNHFITKTKASKIKKRMRESVERVKKEIVQKQ